MPYFVFEGTITPGKAFVITGNEANHIIQSRRIRPGEVILIQDQQNARFETEVSNIKNEKIELLPLRRQNIGQFTSFKIHLFQALVKEKSLDFIIQKTTELGVTSITFFHSRYSQRLKSKDLINRKLTRWNKIALEACKQSGRLTPPSVGFVPNLQKSDQFLPATSIKTFSTICLTSVGNTVSMNQIQGDGKGLNLLVGPEGGWEESDLDTIDCQIVHLGPRILRAETAAVSAVGILQYLFGDLQDEVKSS